jgi:hypothetical protein
MWDLIFTTKPYSCYLFIKKVYSYDLSISKSLNTMDKHLLPDPFGIVFSLPDKIKNMNYGHSSNDK